MSVAATDPDTNIRFVIETDDETEAGPVRHDPWLIRCVECRTVIGVARGSAFEMLSGLVDLCRKRCAEHAALSPACTERA